MERVFRKGKFRWSDIAKGVYLEQLEQHGGLSRASREIGTINRVVLAERKADEEFDEACKEALALFQESIEAEIRRRAVEGVEEPVFFQGIETSSKTVYSDSLLQMYAKANMEKYGDKSKAEVVITGGILLCAPPAASTESWLASQEAQQLPPAQDGDEEPAEDLDANVIDAECVTA